MAGNPYTSKRKITFNTVQPPVTIPVRGLVVTVTAAAAGVGFGTVVLAGLPQGNILLRAAVCYLRFQTTDTDVIAAFNGDLSIGTTADADGTLATTEVDIIPSTPLGPATARVTAFHRAQSAATGHLLTNNAMLIDNTDGSVKLNLNVLVDAADITDAQNAPLTVDGVVYLDCTVMGDD
jgi:hypothetical protein